MSAATVPAPVVPAIEGVTLEQYAGVSAALIEGFALGAVLQSEGLAADAWPRASLRWSQQLARDGAGGPLAARYRSTVGFARGWLGRKVAPLEDDLGAWLGFLNAWSAHPAPFDLLDQLAISPADVARIQGAWAQRVEQDEGLRRKALELAKKKPSAIPELSVTRAEFKPFPWTKKQAAPIPEEPALQRPKLSSSFVGDAIGLERYAALHAELLPPKTEKAAVLARQALTEETFAALEQRWQRRFALDPTLAQDFRRLVRYYEARLKARAGKPDSAPEVRGAPAPTEAPPMVVLAGTSLALDVPRGPALPFARDATPAAIVTAPEAKPGLPRPAARFAGTSLAVEVPRGSALPFATSGEAPLAPPGPAKEGIDRPAARLAGTSLALDVPIKASLPFIKEAPAADAAAPVVSMVARPPAELSGTSFALDAPRGPVLPFAAGGEAPGGKQGELSPDLRAALAGHAPAPSQAPALTLEQHASLTVEIALAPERALEILARYQLTVPAKVAVDAHYREKVAASAEVRAAWDRAYRAYYEWLMQTRAGRR